MIRRTHRRRWVLGSIVVLCLAAGVSASFIPSGDVVYEPVAPIELDGKVTIDGDPADALQGSLYLVGVLERPVSLLDRVLLMRDGDLDFAPAPDLPDDGGPLPEDVASMALAKRVAAGVAYDLAEPGSVEWSGSGATVAVVERGGPADGALRPGDVITRIDGAVVKSAVDATRTLQALPAGSHVRLGVVRAGHALQPTITTEPARGHEPGVHSRIGVSVSTDDLKISLKHDVSIDSGEVVGPSAGLAFALYLYDAIVDRDVLQGRYVVASGAIAPDGHVLEVGRIRQKAIAAQHAHRDVILVPAANASEARSAVRDACGSGESCVEVVPVDSVAEAVALLELAPEELSKRLARDTG